ncbi:MAG: hypothetical protein ACOYL8_04185 [Patescibacteria group bacterium]
MKKFIYIVLKTLLILILGIFLLLSAGFFAVRFGWTNVAGEENTDSFEYNKIAKEEIILIRDENVKLPEIESIYGPNEELNRCKLGVASRYNDLITASILKAYLNSRSEILLNRMLLALKLRLPNREAFEADILNCEKNSSSAPSLDELRARLASPKDKNIYSWQNGESWSIIREAIIKDKKSITDTALEAGVQPRLLLSVAIVEQLRLYYTQRELFEKFFKPLKILANANKMAWGVMSIKEKMAIQTEDYLKDSNSVFYPGDAYNKLLDFPDNIDKNKERYNRLTNSKDHYYSYLYGSLIIKELESQWKKAGYSLAYRPEIIATLFNIGFDNSKPKEDPMVGGSTIEIEGEKYFFGSLAYEFYYSGELVDEFPFN